MIAAAFLVALLASALLLAALARMLPPSFLAASFNSRSNHTDPARQIGGLAVMPAVLLLLLAFLPDVGWNLRIGLLIAGLLLTLLGFLDDRGELDALPKLAGQAAAATIFVLFLDSDFRLMAGFLPLAAERCLMALFLIWFSNMVNFMDGLDLMVVSGVGVPLAVIAATGFAGFVGYEAGVVAGVTAGALFGFALFNWPPARIFLGDSGSLPIGFLAGCVVLLVAREHPVAGLVPFAYFLLDTISVLIRRAVQGANIFKAHSTHAYQVARRAGWRVLAVSGWVAAVSTVASVAAGLSMIVGSLAAELASAAVAFAASAALAMRFRR